MTHVSTIISPRVRTHGAIVPEAAAYAIDKLDAALHHTPAPVLDARLTLDAAAPGNRVDAHVNVNGLNVHVHAIAATMPEAVDLMQERLRSRLRRIRRNPDQGPPPPRTPDIGL